MSSTASRIAIGCLVVGVLCLLVSIALWKSADRFLLHGRPMMAQVEAVRWQEGTGRQGIMGGHWVMTFAVDLPDGRRLRSEWLDLRVGWFATADPARPAPTYPLGSTVPARVVATDPLRIEPDEEELVRLPARNIAQVGVLWIALGVVFLLGDMIAKRFGR